MNGIVTVARVDWNVIAVVVVNWIVAVAAADCSVVSVVVENGIVAVACVDWNWISWGIKPVVAFGERDDFALKCNRLAVNVNTVGRGVNIFQSNCVIANLNEDIIAADLRRVGASRNAQRVACFKADNGIIAVARRVLNHI